VGALIIGTLNNSLNLLHVEHFWQKVVLGGVILLASLADAGLRRLERR
jgi:ribose/xylose/arabinose/galactoside ABC-type transport system permease subunit